MYTWKFFWGTKILIPAMRVKTANLTWPIIPSAPFFELTRRKVRKIKKFQKGHKYIPKNLFEVQKF